MSNIKIDRRNLPKGIQYRVSYEARQVIDIHIAWFVTEYHAQVLEDEQRNQFITNFPDGVKLPMSVKEYGLSLKPVAVYMSQFQLIPYDRITEYFQDQMLIPVSVGSLFNFDKEAYEGLDAFAE